MYIVLSILCYVVNNFPELIVPAGFLAYYSTGRLAMIIGDGAATTIVKTLIPICIVLSVLLSVIMTFFVWRHYEETVSRGIRRWMSNLKFFQNRLGYTIATFFESLLFVRNIFFSH